MIQINCFVTCLFMLIGILGRKLEFKQLSSFLYCFLMIFYSFLCCWQQPTNLGIQFWFVQVFAKLIYVLHILQVIQHEINTLKICSCHFLHQPSNKSPRIIKFPTHFTTSHFWPLFFKVWITMSTPVFTTTSCASCSCVKLVDFLNIS